MCKILLFRTYSLDDVLCILVYVYSLAGDNILESEDEETALQVIIYSLSEFSHRVI